MASVGDGDATSAAGAAALMPGLGAQPHARAVLEGALAAGAQPSHAYLFHGPSGSGKRAAARAFAAALLADDADELGAIPERVAHGSHPDLTWVTPSGAAEMLVSDVDEPVVSAAARTPFESARRVFVIERVETMNDEAANRLLKTLEEPPSFVHMLLLTDRRAGVAPTISSRCQHVRFDPLAPRRIAVELERVDAVEAQRALACARLSLGDAAHARRLASARGDSMRSAAESFVRSALRGETERREWAAMLEQAAAAGDAAGEAATERLQTELELVPAKERKRFERESTDARRRGERRARTHALDEMLALCELSLRDALCVSEGVPELVHAVDRVPALEEDAREYGSDVLRDAVALVHETRLALPLNVGEELALEALAYRLQELAGRGD
jgi:DNA polymerase III subunit delta'